MPCPRLFQYAAVLLVILGAQLDQVTGNTPQWQQYPSKVATKRRRHCSVYCPNMDVMLAFGGYSELFGAATLLTNLELFDFTSATWSRLGSGYGYSPEPRWDCGFELVFSDPGSSSCSVVLYGGASRASSVDVWLGTLTSVRDPTNGRVTYEAMSWKPVFNKFDESPEHRYRFASAQLRGDYYLFGGMHRVDRSDTFDDLWRMELLGEGNSSYADDMANGVINSVVSVRWTQVGASDEGIRIARTADPQMVALEHENELVLYGGVQVAWQTNEGQTTELVEPQVNDMWRYSAARDDWTKVRDAIPDDANKFSREGHMMVALGSRVYLLGGKVFTYSWATSESTKVVLPAGILAASPANVNPMELCDPNDEVGLVWCAPTNLVDIPGRMWGPCVLRNQQIACYGGIVLDELEIINDVVTLDLSLLSDGPWEPANESLSHMPEWMILAISSASCFAISCMCGCVVCWARSRASDEPPTSGDGTKHESAHGELQMLPMLGSEGPSAVRNENQA